MRRISVLKQDHFAYEDFTVLILLLWGIMNFIKLMKEKDELYSKADFSEEDGMKAAKLEERLC